MNATDDQSSEQASEKLARAAAIQREQLRRANLLPAMRQRIAAAPARRVRRLTWWIACSGIAAALGVAAVVALNPHGSRALSYSTGLQAGGGKAGDVLQAGRSDLPVSFSDGTRVVLGSGSRARVLALDATGARVALSDGSLDASVAHTATSRWFFEAGPYRVRVTGTAFVLTWNARDANLSLTMREGAVEVTSAGGDRATVRAGQSLRATAASSGFDVTDMHQPARVDQQPPAAPADSANKGVTASPAPPSPRETPPAAAMPRGTGNHAPQATSRESWRKMAAAARYGDALLAAERAGFETECRRATEDELLLLGDVARLAGDAGRAEQAYRAARRRFPTADRPAFALGLVAFQQRRDFNVAASWFETYLRLFPSGALAREAAGRLVESLDRAGDTAAARRAATDYLARYPGGPHAPLARRIMAP